MGDKARADRGSRPAVVKLLLLLMMGVARPCTAEQQKQQQEAALLVPLPDGSRPEGVAPAGAGGGLWVACLSGRILYVDAAANTAWVVHQELGVAFSGAKFDTEQQTLFVAGSLSGRAFLFHVAPSSGGGSGSGGSLGAPFHVVRREVVALGSPGLSYINDVALGPSHAYFTDSLHPVIYAVPLRAAAGGGEARPVRRHATGPFFDTRPGQFRANGLALYASAGGEDSLLVANTHTGNMYSVVVASGGADGGGDGEARVTELALPAVRGRAAGHLLLDGVVVANGSFAFAADNYNNRVWGLAADAGLSAGRLRLACVIDLPAFGVPTTLALGEGGILWAVNAHLDTCFPFLPCPRHKFELLGVRADVACAPWPAKPGGG